MCARVRAGAGSSTGPPSSGKPRSGSITGSDSPTGGSGASTARPSPGSAASAGVAVTAGSKASRRVIFFCGSRNAPSGEMSRHSWAKTSQMKSRGDLPVFLFTFSETWEKSRSRMHCRTSSRSRGDTIARAADAIARAIFGDFHPPSFFTNDRTRSSSVEWSASTNFASTSSRSPACTRSRGLSEAMPTHLFMAIVVTPHRDSES